MKKLMSKKFFLVRLCPSYANFGFRRITGFINRRHTVRRNDKSWNIKELVVDKLFFNNWAKKWVKIQFVFAYDCTKIKDWDRSFDDKLTHEISNCFKHFRYKMQDGDWFKKMMYKHELSLKD